MRETGLASVAILAFCACGPSSRDHGPDAGSGSQADASTGGGDGSNAAQTYVYAHTSSTLYRIDPDTLAVQMIAAFDWGSVGTDQMTDIAVDKNGVMIGVSFDRVYRVDPTNAKTTLLSNSLDGSFNGLSFVPATMLGQTGDDVLVGTHGADGNVYRIDPMTGSATSIGNMGAYTSSGDLVAVDGFGTVQTANGLASDQLVRLAPMTFAASAIGGGTGYGQIWGVAFWKNKIYGFTNGGQFVLIDPTTGGAMMVKNTGVNWWGAGVTTVAPILQ